MSLAPRSSDCAREGRDAAGREVPDVSAELGPSVGQPVADANLAEARLAAYVAKVVAAAPVLNPEQRTRLTSLLQGSTGRGASGSAQ